MSDDVIWQVINKQFCSFKIKTDKNQDFCRNEYNVSGLCSRQSCPLANAQYATIKNVDGKLYIYMKTAERAHTPKNMWQRIKLSKDYKKALTQINENLIYWNKFVRNKCKQRFTRLTQVMINERRMTLTEEERSYVGVKHKVKRREETRERKALAAARIEKAIEKELLDRLKSGAYGEHPLNVDDKIWKKVLGKIEVNENKEDEEDFESDEDVELESDDESDVGEVEYVEDEDDEEDELVDMEDLEKWLGDDSGDSDSEDSEDDDEEEEESNRKRQKTTKRRKPRIEVEYEEEPMTNIATH